MAKKPPGRNAPCPCGSGKKYKHCCWEREQLLGGGAPPFARANEMMLQCKLRLEREYEADLRQMRRDTLPQFVIYTVDKSLPEAHNTFYSDWLWFDLLDETGAPMAQDYLRRNAELTPPPLARYMTALARSYLSVYRVTASAGAKLYVSDLFSGDAITVDLPPGSALPAAERPRLLLGRLVSGEDAVVFSGMVLLLEEEPDVADFFCECVQHMQKEQPELPLAELLKANGALLFGLFDYALKRRRLDMDAIGRGAGG